VTVTVVVADDEADLRMILELQLADRGAEVVASVGDGEAAVEACRAHRPDVVLLDHRMPGCDGVEAARRILAEGTAGRVVIASALVDRRLVAELRAVPAAEVCEKYDLFGMVERVLGG
jgi:CheY-like chemotaxis protein